MIKSLWIGKPKIVRQHFQSHREQSHTGPLWEWDIHTLLLIKTKTHQFSFIDWLPATTTLVGDVPITWLASSNGGGVMCTSTLPGASEKLPACQAPPYCQQFHQSPYSSSVAGKLGTYFKWRMFCPWCLCLNALKLTKQSNPLPSSVSYRDCGI